MGPNVGFTKYFKPEIINMLKEVNRNMVSMMCKQGVSGNGKYKKCKWKF